MAGKQDKYKTKAELIEELEELRERVAELEHTQSPSDAVALTNGGLPDDDLLSAVFPAIDQPERDNLVPEIATLNLTAIDLNHLVDQVSVTLRRLVPQSIDIRLAAEERFGMVGADPGAAEQIVVNLFHARV